MLNFQGVTICIPAGGPTSCDGLSATWVTWSTGELRVDPGSYSLCFVPSAAFTPKPLGCLLAASVLQSDAGGATHIIAKTSDGIHPIVRLTFERRVDEEGFMKLARAVEAKRCVAQPRRSSIMGSPCERIDPSSDQLADVIRERCAGCWPIIYAGAELYGQDPCGNNGAEVLLGRGAIVLLDPPEMPGGEWAGTYDLLFYDETSGQPTLRVPVGPKLKLSPQPEAETHSSRLSGVSRPSMAKRMSMGPSVAACFDFTVEGVPVSALTFDREVEAQSFVRDLSVRLRLTRVSLKAHREMKSVGSLKGQLFALRRSSLAARAWRWLIGLAMVTIAMMVFHMCVIYFNDDRALIDVASEVLGNTVAVADALGVAVRDLSTTACQAIEGGRTLPASAVEACAGMPFVEDAHACIRALSTRGRFG